MDKCSFATPDADIPQNHSRQIGSRVAIGALIAGMLTGGNAQAQEQKASAATQAATVVPDAKKISAASPADYEPTQITIKGSGEPATPIMERPFRLATALGFNTTDAGNHGLGAQLEVNKTFFAGGKRLGFRLDPGLKVDAALDLSKGSNTTLDQFRGIADVSLFAPFGGRSEPGTYTADGAFLPIGASFKYRPLMEGEPVGQRAALGTVHLFNLNAHHSVGAGVDIVWGIAPMGGVLGAEQILGEGGFRSGYTGRTEFGLGVSPAEGLRLSGKATGIIESGNLTTSKHNEFRRVDEAAVAGEFALDKRIGASQIGVFYRASLNHLFSERFKGRPLTEDQRNAGVADSVSLGQELKVSEVNHLVGFRYQY